MAEAISIREFARRDGCDEKIVRRKLASGHLLALPDGRIDAALVGTGWRVRKTKAADTADIPKLSAEIADTPNIETLEQEAERLVFKEGRVFDSEAEAKRHKESYNAHLKELEYDREIGLVALIDDMVALIAAEYALVRNRILNIASRIAPRAAVLKSAEEVKALIDKEVALALKELSLDGAGQHGPDAARRTLQGKLKKAR